MNTALSLVVQQMGIGACPHCLTCEQWLCPNPWSHVATAVCHGCEARMDYCSDHAEDCPAVAIARLSVARKATGVMRNQTEVQAHVQAYRARQDQFVDVEDLDETPAELADAYGLMSGDDGVSEGYAVYSDTESD